MRLKETTSTKRVLNTKEAAEYLGMISYRTLEKWRLSNKGPMWVNLEGAIGYRPVDLDDYLEDNLCVRLRKLSGRTSLRRNKRGF